MAEDTVKITKKRLRQIIKEEIEAAELSRTFSPKAGLELDPRYTQSREKAIKRHNRDIYARSQGQSLTRGRMFNDCGVPGIFLPKQMDDKEIHDLWSYIIDERGNRSLFAISIDEMLGISDLGVIGFKQMAKVAVKSAGMLLRKFIPFIGWAETGNDVNEIVNEWNRSVASGFCDVMTMMNDAYWGPKHTKPEAKFDRRHIKMSEWMMHPGYLALIIHYGREQGWSPMKIAQVMVSAGWLHPSEANALRNEILKADLLKIKFQSQLDALENSAEDEADPVALGI